jgi:predicted nucleotidyltransferase
MFSQLTNLFAHEPSVQLALVFGSAARGALKPESDIDVAVLAHHRLSHAEKRALIEQIALSTGRAVDLIDLADVGQPLLGQIMKNAKRVKGTDSQLASLMTRNALDEADFMPYVTRLLQTRRAAWIG